MKPGGAELLCGVFYQDYKKHMDQFLKVYSIHHQGYAWDDWYVNDLTKEKGKKYLRTAQYYAMHPLNGPYSHWIDDKLTLKYLCVGTELDRYMPKYYYQISENGTVLPLSDATISNKALGKISDVCELLQRTGKLALKRMAGSLGEGFYKAEYHENAYFLNGVRCSEKEFENKLYGLKDYLITEYLHPHAAMVPFSADTVNTLRYLIGRDDTGAMRLLKSYIRFGTKESGYVENYNAGGILCFVSEDGKFESGNLLDLKKRQNSIVERHPDTGIELKGEIPLWNEIRTAADLFGIHFPQMDYLGLDFVVTNRNEVKVLEINSLSSLDAIQLDGSILETAEGAFYKKRLRTA